VSGGFSPRSVSRGAPRCSPPPSRSPVRRPSLSFPRRRSFFLLLLRVPVGRGAASGEKRPAEMLSWRIEDPDSWRLLRSSSRGVVTGGGEGELMLGNHSPTQIHAPSLPLSLSLSLSHTHTLPPPLPPSLSLSLSLALTNNHSLFLYFPPCNKARCSESHVRMAAPPPPSPLFGWATSCEAVNSQLSFFLLFFFFSLPLSSFFLLPIYGAVTFTLDQ